MDVSDMVVPPEAVRINSEGVELAGHLYLPGGAVDAEAPGVVICHGLGSRKENHADFARLLQSRGFVALAFDLRGHGQSEGALDEGPVEDVLAAVRHLAGRPEADPSRIALRGSSLGGQLAIHAAARAGAIRAVVAICPAHEALILGREDEPWFETAVDDLARRIRLDREGFSRYLRGHSVTASATRLSPRPLLIVHCRGDEVVPFRLSELLHRRAGQTAELWPVEGGSHTSAQHSPDLQLRAIRWLEERL
jgi:pimeloyl-ACP methyl ester carboxylesterase